MRPVLCQPAIPRFHATELSLDDPEGMFDLGAHHGDDRVELAAFGRLVGDAVIAQFHPGKPAHGPAIIKRLFGHRVALGVPIPAEVNASILSSGIGGFPPFGRTFG